MKIYMYALAVMGMAMFQGCTQHDSYYTTVVNNNVNPVLEVTTSFSAADNYGKLVTINPPIQSADLILVYLLDSVNNGADVWRLLPQKYYPQSGGEVGYNFDYTVNDVFIFMEANVDIGTLPPTYTQNQTFRIVILKGALSGKSSKSVDFKDYNATLKEFNIDPLNVKKLSN